MALNPGDQLGGYEVVELLGSGGMGDVYRARDPQLGRYIALKVLQKDESLAANRFEREARAASALSHPNVCHVYALGTGPEGSQFIAMEFIQGETLRERLRRDRVSLREALDISIQIAGALAASHGAGVVHRDIKPENVMLTEDGLVKVLDFGLAKIRAPFTAADDSTRTLAQTDAGIVVGTIAYMSPEQARGQAVDVRTDIWSLGAVLYEMVAGRSPFAGSSSGDVIASILDRDPQPLLRFEPDAPAELLRILAKALKKNRNERYQTSKDLLLDLKNLRAAMESASRSGSTSDVPRAEAVQAAPPASKRKVITAALAAAVVALAAAAWWLRHSESGAAPLALAGPPQYTLRQLTIAPGITITPAISADGKLMAYASDRGGSHLDIWVQQVAGGEALRLTSDEADDTEPAFTPDGTTIVFHSDRKNAGVYRVSTLGGEQQLIAADGRTPRVSPDGRSIAYWVGRPGSGAPNSQGASRVFVAGINGGAPRQVAADYAAARFPLWAPDGKTLLIFANREATKPSDWCLVSVDDLSQVHCMDAGNVIGEKGAIHEHHAATDWVGDFALYVNADGGAADLSRVRIDANARRLVGPPEALTHSPGVEGDAVFGSAGEIVFADMHTTPDIWSVRLDPSSGRAVGEERQLTSDPARDMHPRASADGSAFVFTSNRAGDQTFDLWIHDLKNGRQRRVTTGRMAVWPALDPSAGRIAYLEEPKDVRTRELHLLSLSTNQDETLCAKDCGTSTPIWASDGRRILTTNGRRIRAFDLAKRQFQTVVANPPSLVWEPSASPDGRWLAFLVRDTEVKGRIVAVPFHPEREATTSEWIDISTDGTEDKPRWSADGHILYFTSERDGFRCIWAQRLDPRSLKLVGPQFAAYHSHLTRRSLKDVGLTPLGIGVTSHELIFNLAEKTSNLWMMMPVQP